MTTPAAAQGGVRFLLRLEGLTVLLVAAWLYSRLGQSWGHFAAWFLLPDVALFAYLLNRQLGAIAYNATHSYLGALAMTCAGFALQQPLYLGFGLIWCAHIGFDRALGYGLKYAAGFHLTHLGLIGRIKSAEY